RRADAGIHLRGGSMLPCPEVGGVSDLFACDTVCLRTFDRSSEIEYGCCGPSKGVLMIRKFILITLSVIVIVGMCAALLAMQAAKVAEGQGVSKGSPNTTRVLVNIRN